MTILKTVASVFFVMTSSLTFSVLGLFHFSQHAVAPIDATAVSPTSSSSQASSTTATTDTQIYNGDGYTIDIPAGLTYARRYDLGNNYETWHSSDNTELIRIQWEADSPSSIIKGTEDANISRNQRISPPIPISHPTIEGADSSTMFEKPLPSPEFYGVYLFVEGANGNIYEIDGIAFSRAAQSSVNQIVGSFALAPF
jgi:hypothetical protein